MHLLLGQCLLRRRDCENYFVYPNTKQINPSNREAHIMIRQKDDGQDGEGNDLFRIN